LRRIDDDCIPFEYEADGVAHDCDDHHCDASGLVLVGQSAASEPWTGTLADQEHRQKSSLDYTPLKFEYREKGTVFLLTIPKGDYHSLPARRVLDAFVEHNSQTLAIQQISCNALDTQLRQTAEAEKPPFLGQR
jgi:hypothetical protein